MSQCADIMPADFGKLCAVPSYIQGVQQLSFRIDAWTHLRFM